MKRVARMLRPSPALVIACIALFLAMGGVGFAALKGKDKKRSGRSLTRRSQSRRPD
jgi:hypothetical protein